MKKIMLLLLFTLVVAGLILVEAKSALASANVSFWGLGVSARGIYSRVTLPGTALSSQQLARKIITHPVKNVAPSVRAKRGLPVRLTIPKINVNAVVNHVGLTSDGAVDVPKDASTVAWYNLGPYPGEKGSAIIDGHFSWKNNLPAVFDNLHKLKKGDKLFVEDAQGIITTFVVRELKTYGEKQNASAIFNANDDKAHLNLITCQGVWNKAKKSYSDRLIVFTDKEET